MEVLMRAETDGDRVTIDTGAGARQPAISAVEACFREVQITRRFLIIAATAFAIAAAITVVFVPQGREPLAWFIGLTLLVLALGAGGYSRFWIRTPHTEIKAAKEQILDGANTPS
jgi:hypothetical protein